MAFDLKTDDGLRRACESVNFDRDELQKTKTFVEEVADVSHELFVSKNYQEHLWGPDNPICQHTTQGPTIISDQLIQNGELLDYFYDEYQNIRQKESQERTDPLCEFVEKLIGSLIRYSTHGENRPEYSTYRALAALFPENFTCLASMEILSYLARHMGIGEGHQVAVHRNILDRLADAEVLGPVESDNLDEVIRRMILPWKLYELVKEPMSLEDISRKVNGKGYFPPDLCKKLHLGLWADPRRHFAVLTGISGSGKTLLARSYAEAITGEDPTGKDSKKSCIAAVQPGWTDPSYLLGYANPLQKDSFEYGPILKLLLHADKNPESPHVAILDEMNLSHPEQYMAPLLSAMETGGSIEIHGRGETFDNVPQSVLYPNNLVLIGTVNMDETTHGLVDKILDRAFTLEFWEVDVDKWPGWESSNLPAEETEFVKKILKELMKALKDARLHFGYRVIEEIVAFLTLRLKDWPKWSLTDALDAVIYAKVLPKLRGDDSKRVREALSDCKKVLQTHGLSRSAKKVKELSDDLEATGSARFWR